MSKTTDLSKVPTQLRPNVAAKITMHETTYTAYKIILDETKQPLSFGELRVLAERRLGRAVNVLTGRVIIKRLIEEKFISSRIETDEERKIRAGGRLPRGVNGALYFKGKSVPRRTAPLEGLILGDGQATSQHSKNYAQRYKAKLRKKKSARRAAAKSTKVPDVVASMQQVIDERDALVKRVAQLEDTLARINKLFVK